MEFLLSRINNLTKLYFNSQCDVDILHRLVNSSQRSQYINNTYLPNKFSQDSVDNDSDNHYRKLDITSISYSNDISLLCSDEQYYTDIKLYRCDLRTLKLWKDIDKNRKVSVIAILKTEDNKVVFLKRRTTFAYDKIINCFKFSDLKTSIEHCIKCVFVMGSVDRARLYKKLTCEFFKIDPNISITNNATSVTTTSNDPRRNIKNRVHFLFFWRKFLLELIDIMTVYFDSQHNDTDTSRQIILPGGKRFKTDDTIVESLKRELREELELDNVIFKNYICTLRIYDPIFNSIHENIVLFSDLCKIKCRLYQSKTNNNEVNGFCFVRYEDLPKIDKKGHAVDPSTIYTCLTAIKRYENEDV